MSTTGAATAPAYPFTHRETVLHAPSALTECRREPAMRVTLPSGDVVWLVTRYQDVRVLLSDERLSRNRDQPDAPRITKDNSMFQDPNVSLDPPDHPRMRRLVAKAFTAARVERMRPHTQELVDRLLDDTAAAGPPADLHRTLTFPLAITTLCELLGVPVEDQKDFRHWTDAFLSVSKYTPEEIGRCRGELFAYIERLVEAKTNEPGGDLISALIAARDEDSNRLSHYELLYWAQGLLMGGYETTASHLGAAIVTLLANPGLLARVRDDLSLVPQALEEMLRLQVLFSSMAALRYAKEEIEVGGMTIPRGAGVVLAMESANRDETVFPDPETLDIDRPSHLHLAFSAGPHHCAGSALARMEMQTAITSLLRRFPTLKLAVDPLELRRAEGGLVEGFLEVPVTW
ncbi:cytochrome P450 [Streptosporangium becharense]|uniref:Cytochrome P450 n=1 Tax=Streptosporangium becharense TaxID=1816182 RepID=A0A7W9IM86_9ACTN|nr:cytochrome P450 [Streptosporangium becharense]MBB2910443.1 cytochrome P450 [Streptosporangium becharense]MBB5823186.1 cytochrome P450 [Streptosporangium becharense]